MSETPVREGARRSARSAMGKLQRCVEHPDEVLRLKVTPRERVFIRWDDDRQEWRHLVDHNGCVASERPIPHHRAVELAQVGEATYRSLGYYRAEQCPADRPEEVADGHR